ncbi:MAG: acyl carrier protein [Saprospiraceae bacterium]
MKIQHYEKTLKDLMALVFKAEKLQIDVDSSIDNIDNWDSITHLNLIIALEEEFDVSIPDDDVGNMINYKIILHIITELKEK